MYNKIAIVGMSGKYSKADNLEEFWDSIIKGCDFSYWGDKKESTYVDRYSKINDIDLFDNEFFGFTPYEAKITDPQQRILLECCYLAMEDAGYADITEKKCIGVFTSVSMSSYLINNVLKNSEYYNGEIDYNILIGNDKDFSSTRASYKLNLSGPAFTVQSACSSSLVALHNACISLQNFECDAALVGGSSISVPQEKGYYYKDGGIMSKDGICRPFDNEANGTIKGNGCSVIMIKRLEDAISDGDRIYAVISGTAINNDASAKIGFTAPSIEGQKSAIKECIEYSQIPINEIDYIEAHGTGTKLGDPIEIKALSEVFSDDNCKGIAIGSVKANVGHLDVASGLTSVIKSVYMLNNGIIPGNINFKNQNSEFSFEENKFYFPKENEYKDLRNLGISSFGLGGTNAHIILSKYHGESCEKVLFDEYLLPISYLRTEDKDKLIKNINDFVKKDNVCIQDMIYTLSVGKRKFKNNLFVLFNGKDKNSDIINSESIRTFDNQNIDFTKFSLKDYKDLYKLLPSYAAEYDYNKKETYSSEYEEYMYRHCSWILYISNICSEFEKINFNGSDSKLVDLLMTSDCSLEDIIREVPDIEMSNSVSTDLLHDLLMFIGQLNCIAHVDFRKVYEGLGWKITNVPQYPLSKKSFWIEPDIEEKVQNRIEEKVEISKESYLEKVLSIWKNAFGFDDIKEDDDFYDIDGDSLLLISMLDKINKAFEINLKFKEINSLTTPISMADYIYEMNKEKVDKESFISQIRVGSKDAKNLFLIHPAGGTTFCYSMLNQHIDKEIDINIYAIDMPENYSDYDSIPKLANLYTDAILNIQKEGIYYVGGYSFGGNIACEIAGILIDRGYKTSEVLMFDSHPPIAYNTYKNEPIDYRKVFPIMVANYFQLDKNYILNIINDKNITIEAVLKEMQKTKDGEILIKDDEINGFFDKWVYGHKLLKKHELKYNLPLKALIFRGNETEDSKILSSLQIKTYPKEEWNKHFAEGVKIVDTDGNHYSMFGNAKNIKTLAKIMEENYQW